MHQQALSRSDILATVERILPDLPPALRKVGLFALRSDTFVATRSLDEVAQAAGVSKPTVVRFCQAAGFSGFREFQRALLLVARTPAIDESERASQAANASAAPSFATATETLHSLAASVQRTCRLADDAAVRRAAEWLSQARRIIWYGIGDSSFLALSGDHRCMINGFHSKGVTRSQDLIDLSRQLGPEDVVVCISRSGRRPRLVQAIRHLKRHAPVRLVAVTGDPGSPLALAADLTLLSAPVDVYAGGQRTTLQTAQMAVLDTLIAQLLHMRFGLATEQTMEGAAP